MKYSTPNEKPNDLQRTSTLITYVKIGFMMEIISMNHSKTETANTRSVRLFDCDCVWECYVHCRFPATTNRIGHKIYKSCTLLLFMLRLRYSRHILHYSPSSFQEQNTFIAPSIAWVFQFRCWAFNADILLEQIIAVLVNSEHTQTHTARSRKNDLFRWGG